MDKDVMKAIQMAPITKLVDELINRHENIVIGFTAERNGVIHDVYVRYKTEPSFLTALGLCESLKDAVLQDASDMRDDGSE